MFTSRRIVFIIILTAVLINLPLWAKPNLFLNRGNDLQEFFWPTIQYSKEHILSEKSLPLWNTTILSGTPILPDPQAPLFYLPNIIFLVLPISSGFLILIFLHILLGGFASYSAARFGFGFKKHASIFTAILYMTTPLLAGFIEAGHYGLITSWAWIPLVILATIKLIKSPSYKWSVLLAISMAQIFFCHTLVFALSIILSFAIFAYLIFETKKININAICFYAISTLMAIGLTAISLLPQLEWTRNTTRYLLIGAPDMYPTWSSIIEFIKNIFVPWQDQNIRSIATEKWISIGVFPSILATLGFFKLTNKRKISIMFMAIIISFIALNNASPIYSTLLNQNWYKLLRVSTRIWFIVPLIIIFLAGYELNKSKNKLINLFAFFAIIETLFLSWNYLSRMPTGRTYLNEKVAEILAPKNNEIYRIFCIDRCISQKDAVKYNLELVEGYNTVQQINYNQRSWELSNSFWNYYSLSIPPIGIYKFEQLQPMAEELAKHNTKYVISPHELIDPKFSLLSIVDDHYIYQTCLLEPRANAPIIKYLPNLISMDTTNLNGETLIVKNIYSPGWKAYLNGIEEIKISESPIHYQTIQINPDTEFVELKYGPDSYKYGKYITLITITFMLLGATKLLRNIK